MRTIEAEEYFVCSLEVGKFTGTKGDKVMKRQLVEYDNKRVGATFHRIPTKYYTAISKAERMGRDALADGNWLWTSKQPGDTGKASSMDGYLVHHEDFHDLDKRMTKARNAFWSAVEENIIRMYDFHRRQGMIAYREATGQNMSDTQVERFYPDISEVRKAFDFRFKPLPLYGLQSDGGSHIWHPSWSDEKRDLFERVQQAAVEDQERRVQNGMESLVGRVLDVARTHAENISQFENSDGEKATGLPYANTWAIMENLADELDKWGGRVQNDNGRMRGLAADIHNMMSGINAATSGNVSELRGMMSQDHSPIRDQIGSQLKNIERSASSALEDLIS
jgi:hypothetical protein